MLEKIRQFLESKAGKAVAIVFSVIMLAVAATFIIPYFKGETPDSALYTTYICTETGKTFKHKNVIGEVQPIFSKFSGKNTAYPAEACYWTKEGTVKKEPTWVLLNELADKPGPTFCPDCGRLVVGHNPYPTEDSTPPPTEEEYNARRGSRKNQGQSREDR